MSLATVQHPPDAEGNTAQIGGARLACIFSGIFHKKPREYTKYYLRFLFHLPKNLSAQSAHPYCAVLPEQLCEAVRREALTSLLNDDRAEPWYGQLMTTPQTIAYMLQLNYWLRRYRVRIL